MALAHALVPQTCHERQVGLELLELGLDLLGDAADGLHLLVLLEGADGLEEEADASRDLVLAIPRVDLVEGAVQPFLLVFDPVPGRFPQIRIRLERLDHRAQARVVRLITVEQKLARIELLDQILALFDLLVRLPDLLCHIAHLGDVLVLPKVVDDLLQSHQALLEGLLVADLLIEEFLVLHVQILLAFGRLRLHIARCAEHFPSSVQGFGWQDVAQILNQIREVHGLLDAALQLRQLPRHGLQELPHVGNLLDVRDLGLELFEHVGECPRRGMNVPVKLVRQVL
mmetsp:Transcript_19101/g.54834  ORF Transcript_19101/g.54834 Transcript_19101/m.54834 type:complete len:285 (+) Transcript_19101:660-1514(+)